MLLSVQGGRFCGRSGLVEEVILPHDRTVLQLPALQHFNHPGTFKEFLTPKNGNDLGHQGIVAQVRSRPEENKTIGINIEDPNVDFVGMARSFGAWAEGPIERAEDLKPAFERARKEVVENGRVALVHVYTQHL